MTEQNGPSGFYIVSEKGLTLMKGLYRSEKNVLLTILQKVRMNDITALVTQAEIADITGMSRNSVQRAYSMLRGSEAIAVGKYRRIYLNPRFFYKGRFEFLRDAMKEFDKIQAESKDNRFESDRGDCVDWEQ